MTSECLVHTRQNGTWPGYNEARPHPLRAANKQELEVWFWMKTERQEDEK